MSEAMHAFSVKHGDLSSAVDKAVADVLAKHQLVASKNLALGPGTLIGRMLREFDADKVNIATVQRAAAEIAGQVSGSLGVAKGGFTPAAVISGGVITMGFIAREMVQFV